MRVNEKSQLTVTANLLDGRSAAVPTSVHWRLECLETGTVLQDWTAVATSTTTDDDGNVAECEATIEIVATLNAMQTPAKKVERKALCVSADKDLSTEFNDEMIYEVERLNART